jgi:PAS domain S-box-containing protein
MPEISSSSSNFLVTGLGGSAGSIPSFREFFRNVPEDSGMAFVVILHLSPDHDSHLAEVLQSSARMPVLQVREPVKVQPDHVYVIPPNKSMAMQDGTLVLSDVTGFEERRAPIDIFFRTLAETHDSRAVCVVLSGSGSDGSMGLRRVKEYNGLVLVQDPGEAEFGEMPRSCIATGLVDFVLPVSQMPNRIMDYRDQMRAAPVPHDRSEADEQALLDIFTTLRTRTGHDFTNYKRATVARRIERRVAVREMKRLADYAEYLRERPEENEALLRELLISVTNFFRDPAVWQRVEETVVPRLLERKRGTDEHLRVWVPGCATGEEAYTVAMILADAVAGRPGAPNIQIFATDLDEDAIAKARNGYYNAAEIADVPPDRLRRHFIKEQDGYRIRRDLRELVLFAHHNVIKDPPFSHVDFVSCRNLLIYLNRTAQERTMEVLHFALEPGGFLLLGTAESVDGAGQLFSLVDKEAHIWESRAVPRVMKMPAPVQLTIAADLRNALPPTELRTDLRGVRFGPLDLHQRILEEYAAPSLVADEQHNIVHLSDRAGKYLQFAAGEASLNLLQVVRPEIRMQLRSGLFQAAQKRTTVVIRGVVVHSGERAETVNLVIRPVLREGDPARGFFLVLFEEAPEDAPEDAPMEVREATTAEPVARQLEEELVRLKSQMRATVEQYELQAEEAKAANEELQAINEELRSTAEELETSQEELQSLNEELQTVNQELKVKIEEISHANDDMRNLMSSTEIGTIFVDRGLRVKLFTPRVRDVFNLITADVGRSLLDINSKLTVDELAADVERVLDDLHTVEREVQTRAGRWHLMRLLPYRTSDDRIDGVVLTFLDITERRLAQEEVVRNQVRQAFLLALSDRLRSIGDPQEIMAAAAEMFARHLRVAAAEYALVDGQGAIGTFASYNDGRLPRTLRAGEEVFCDDCAGEPRYAELAQDGMKAGSSLPLLKNGRVVAIVSTGHVEPHAWSTADELLHRDVAERVWTSVERARAEHAQRDSEARLEADLAGMRRLYELHARLAGQTDLGVALDEILATAVEFGGTDRGTVQLAGEEGNRLEIVAHRGYREGSPFIERFPSGTSVQPKQRVVIEDISTFEPLPGREAALAEGIQAMQSTPMVSRRGETVGVLSTQYRQRYRPTEHQLRLIDLLAWTAADFVERHNADAQLRANEMRQTFLLALADALRTADDPGELHRLGCSLLGEQLQADRVHYGELREDGFITISGDFHREGLAGLQGDHRLDDFGAMAHALRSGITATVPDTEDSPSLGTEARAAFRAVEVRSFVSVPLLRNGTLVRLLSVLSRQPRVWTRNEIRLVEETAERLWTEVERARAEAALRESRERLQKAISIETVGVLFFSLDGRIYDANEAFQQMSGYTVEELRNLGDWMKLTPPEFREVTERSTESMIAHGQTAPYEKQMIRKDGTRWWGLFAPARLSGTGRTAECVEFISDITAKKVVEDAMAAELEATRMLRELAARPMSDADGGALYDDLVAVAVRLTRADGGTLQRLDRASGELVLLASAGFDGQTIARLARVSAQSATPLTTRQRSIVDFDEPEAGYRSAQSTPLFSRAGQPIGMLSTHWREHRRPGETELRYLDLLARQAADLLERKAVETELRNSEGRLQALANLVPDLLWSSGPTGASDWHNQRWLEYTGQTLEQTRGYGWTEAIHPEDRRGAVAQFTKAVETGQPLREEHRIRAANGEYRWFLVQAQPLRDESGNIVRWFGAATDIHEQRVRRDLLEEHIRERTIQLEELSAQRQQLLERLVTAAEEERQRIARELHDEMGQHVTALKVALATVQPASGLLDQMKGLVDRLDRTVDRLTLELRPPALDHLGLYGAITSLADGFAAASGVAVDVHLTAVEHQRFSDAIESTVYRVVQEALTNVWKHAAAKTVSIILDRDGEALRLIVEDDGDGFDGDGALDGPAAGGRFGLLGMRERLALVRGTLEIESQPGSGTSLYARVPLTDPARTR